MRFASLQGNGVSDYANAGKAVAKSAEKSFATQRKYGPDYGKLSMTAMKTQTEEKIAAMRAEANVVNAGIKATANVKKESLRQDAYKAGRDIDKKMRKAGSIAAIGTIAGAGFLAMSDPEKGREMPTNKTEREKLMADHQKTTDEINSRREASSSDALERLTSLLSTGNPSVSTNDTSGADSPGKVTTGDAPSTPPSTPPSGSGSSTYDGTFQSVYNIAKGQGARYPELVAAQWQLESASGSSPSGANNFFGIKAAGGESGTVKGTWEEGSSGAYNTSARFKNFERPEDSINEVVTRWHQDYKGYRGANNSGTAADAARYLRSQGYATDSKYADKLIDIMQRNGYGN